MQIEKLIDQFVSRANSHSREHLLLLDEVPESLREAPSDGISTNWRIARADHAAAVRVLQDKIKKRLPPSFEYFISNYSFPAFEYGPLIFVPNARQESPLELEERIFGDSHMSPALLNAGFIQIGKPCSGSYDPVYFDTNRSRHEHPIVQLDHELAIQFGKTRIVEEIASSFIDLLKEPTMQGGT